jgi:predicted  nucleic acid-binding Zn-ribbon protein
MAKPEKPLTPPTPSEPWEENRLGSRIETMLTRFGIRVVDGTKEVFGEIIRFGLGLFLEAIEGPLSDQVGGVIDTILETDELPPEVRSYLQELRSPTDQASAVGLSSIAISAGSNTASAMLAPIMRFVNYAIDSKIRSSLPDIDALSVMRWRRPEAHDWLTTAMKARGWPDRYHDIWPDVLRPRPEEGDLLTAWVREILPEDVVNNELEKRGWLPEDRAVLKRLTERLPGPGDLVNFALREVWRGDLRGELLSPDAPGRYYELMEKQGFSREFAADYWAAHWQLPSVGQGFQMFWRVPGFDEGDLRQLLTRLDILPRYHDALIDVAYQPLTRVDIRRMHDLGVLDNDQVLEAYRHHGFNPRDAQRMLEFTIDYNARGERELTKADILGGLNDGMLSGSEAEQWLIDIEYPPELAAFLVAREQAQMARKRTNKRLDIIEDLYTLSDISRSEAIQRMNALGLSSTEIDLHLDEWDIDRGKRVERPSRSKLEGFLLEDIITRDVFEKQMEQLGYQDQYIDWYLTEVLEKKAELTRKEEREAREEQQDIREREIKTDYQVQKAEIDLDIAEIRTAVAETQIALDTRRNRYLRDRRLAQQALTEQQLRDAAAQEIAQIEDQIATRREAIQALRQDIEGYQTEIQRARLQRQERLEQAQPEINDIEAEIAALESEIDGHQEIIADLGTQIQAVRSRIATLQTNPRLVEIDAEIAARRTRIEDHQVQIDQLQTEIQDIKTDIARLEEQLPKRIERATSDVEAERIESNAEQQILTWERQIEELRGEIEREQDLIAELQAEIDRLQEERSETLAQQEIDTAKREIEELEGRIDEQQALIAQARSKITVKREDLRLLKQPARASETRIQQLRLDIESAQDQIEAFESEIEERQTLIQQRREQLRQDINRLEQLPKLQTVESEYQTDRENLEGRLNDLRVNLRELKESKAQLDVQYRQSLAEA